MAAQRFSDLHCSLDGRSWTNPITNATFLAEVKLEQYLKSLFMTGDTPPDVQLAFFHEAMHHWCFLSPVGSTLAFLQLRAYRRAYKLHRDKAASDDEKTALLEDLIRYTTASSLMRPFAEGLALFAQFDAGFWLSKNTAVVSDLNEWANFFFNVQQIDRERIFDFPYVPPVRLIGTRLSQQAIESKAGLLCNPLTCANGGYLPGYLLVKSLWSRARAQCHERFKVSDLFLAYLRSFIYDDYGFVAVLLDPFTQEYETANAITTYFSRRFQQFMKSDLEADVKHFEKAVLEKEKYRSGKSGGDIIDNGLLRLCTDAETDKLGRERLLDMIDEMDRYYSDPSDDFLHAMNRAALFQRDIMRVGSLQLSISIARTEHTTEHSPFDETGQEIVLSSSRKVLLRLPVPPDAVQKELLMGCEYDTGALEIMTPYAGLGGRVHVCFPAEVEEGEGEGSLELFFSLLATYSVCAISFNRKPIAYLFLDPSGISDPRADDKAARELFLYRHAEKAYLEETHIPVLGQILEHVVDNGDWWVKETLDDIQEKVLAALDRFYLPLALLYVPDKKLEQCIDVMSKRGFYEILGRDGSLVRALALLGIASSLTATREVIARWFASYGIDLDTTIAALRQYGEQLNQPEILEQGDLLGCFV